MNRLIITTLLSGILAGCNSSTSPVTLKQQSWILEQIDGKAITTEVTLRIADDLTASGNAGCNYFNGQGELEQNRFRINMMALTRRLCPPEIMQIENIVSNSLSDWSDTGMTRGKLKLTTSEHQLLFRPE